MRVLVPNLGSTSLKFRVIEFPGEEELAGGRMQRIGQSGGDAETYREAIERVLDDAGTVDAVGFKAVHAGPRFRGTFLIDGDLLAAMREFEPAAPLHNGIYLKAIADFRALCPGIPLVAAMETGFHKTMSAATSTYGVPAEWREKHGVRRYGFHGASHRHVAERAPKVLDLPPMGLRIVSCHLGGSSSICAIRNGVSIDISMGFSPQSGIESATRHGDFDVFGALFMMERLQLSPEEMREVLVRDCGLAGLSGIAGGDLRDIEAAAANGSASAALAIEVFASRIRMTIASYASLMGGLDGVVFTGGIGENATALRLKICRGLEFLGLEISEERNANEQPDCRVSREGSAVACIVLAAEEELVVGREVYRLLSSALGVTLGEQKNALGERN